MSLSFLRLPLIILAFQLHASAQPPGDSWKLVFEDNFDGPTLDPRKWSANYPWGRTHNHRAYMDPTNVTIHKGHLLIRARDKRHPKAPAVVKHGGKTHRLDYQAGAIHTSSTFRFKHGYVEARMKMPEGKGFWPAFWMLSEGWPPEIDIMEFLSSQKNTYHAALHYGKDWKQHKSHGGFVKALPDLSAGFHDYGMKWEADKIEFYFDGRKVRTVSDRNAVNSVGKSYLILNLAVGGWEKNPDAKTRFERNWFEVDWVRVWKTR